MELCGMCNSQPSTLTITTGSRLHCGLLSHNPRFRRQFGGVGLMIDVPRFQILVDAHDRDVVEGAPEFRNRGEQFLADYRANCPPGRQPPKCRIRIHDGIPRHVGLGSGTQLGMAISQALALLAQEGDVDAIALASRVCRGARSALGIHGFARGGFLIDAGKGQSAIRNPQSAIHNPQSVGTLVCRTEFPADWRLVLVTPAGQSGLSGDREREAFARLPPMPQGTTNLLSRIALMELLPAVIEADFAACSSALFDFGRTVGEYFAPVQGGTYADASMAELVEYLGRQGLHGIGQTSWGPTIFVLCADSQVAEQLVADVSADARWSGCRCRTAAPMNTGALVQTTSA